MHSAKCNNYTARRIFRLTTSKGGAVVMGTNRNSEEIMAHKPERKGLLEEEGFYRNTVGWCRLDSFGSELGPLADSCELDNNPSRSIHFAGSGSALSSSCSSTLCCVFDRAFQIMLLIFLRRRIV
jgi:hypothetical protein